MVKNSITTDDMKIFLAIKNSLNITKAANNLHLSQSTVSYRLKALEQDLGVKLFLRGKGQQKIELTPEGESLVAIAEKISVLQDEAKSLSAKRYRPCLTIGCINSLNIFLLTDFYAQIVKQQPEIGMRVLTRHTWELYEMLESRYLDIGIVNNAVRCPDIKIELLMREKYVLLRAGEGIDGQTVHLSELDPTQEIYQYYSPDYAQWHDYWWSGNQAIVSTDNAAMLKLLHSNPKLWAIVPLSIAKIMKEDSDSGLVWYNLSDPPPERNCYVITHKYPASNVAHTIESLVSDLRVFVKRRF